MKKVSEIMEELGFKEDASFEVKKVFIKNLIQQANVVDLERERIKKVEGKRATDKDADKFIQLDLFSSRKTSG